MLPQLMSVIFIKPETYWYMVSSDFHVQLITVQYDDRPIVYTYRTFSSSVSDVLVIKS